MYCKEDRSRETAIREDSGKPIQANSQDVPTYFRCRKTTDVNILNFDGIGNKASLDLNTDCGLFWRESTFFTCKFAAPCLYNREKQAAALPAKNK